MFDHGDCVSEVVFAGAEPSCEGVGFGFGVGEGIDCVVEFAASFVDFLAEFGLCMILYDIVFV